jgi:hypothetical protein
MAQIVDAIAHADAHGDAQDKYNDAAEAAEMLLGCAYLALCANGDAKALAHFAPLDQTLDYNRGPSSVDMLQVVLDAALGKDVTAKAIELRNRMAKTYAQYNVDTTAIHEATK